MLEDEIGWLTNFTATREVMRERPESGVSAMRYADNILLAGHLMLISALMSCEGINKEETGNYIQQIEWFNLFIANHNEAIIFVT